MNLLIVSQYYYPEQFLINEIAEQFVKNGHNVTVVTGLPNYPQGKVKKEYKWHKKRHEFINGVEVIRCYEADRHDGAIGLAINYMSFALSASLRLLFTMKKYDAVFCYQVSPITQAIPAIIYSCLHRVPLLLYCLDIFPESVKSHTSETSVVYKSVAWMSNFIYNKCDRVAVTSMPFIHYLNNVNNVDIDKMVYIPQHADAAMLEADMTPPEGDAVNLMFAGNVGYGQNLEVLIDAAEKINSQKQYKIHIVGDGSRLKYLKEQVSQKGLDSIFVFHGRQPKEKMQEFYKMADALIITLRGNNYVGNTLPGKLQMYMTAGKPILGSINGAGYEEIMNSGCGACINAGDAEGFAEILTDFIESPEKYLVCGENARKYFKDNFTFDIFMSEVTKEIDNLIRFSRRKK